jgi:hypothetical protein
MITKPQLQLSIVRLFLETMRNCTCEFVPAQISAKREKKKSPFTMVILVKTSCGKKQSMLNYMLVRFGSCAKASGTVPVNSLFDKSLKENVKKK